MMLPTADGSPKIRLLCSDHQNSQRPATGPSRHLRPRPKLSHALTTPKYLRHALRVVPRKNQNAERETLSQRCHRLPPQRQRRSQDRLGLVTLSGPPEGHCRSHSPCLLHSRVSHIVPRGHLAAPGRSLQQYDQTDQLLVTRSCTQRPLRTAQREHSPRRNFSTRGFRMHRESFSPPHALMATRW